MTEEEMEQMEQMEQLKKYDISTPFFSLQNINTYGRLVDIYDGDTMKIILPVMGTYFKFNVRLNGIDTCEIKSHNIENKNKAIKARNRICEMIETIHGNYADAKLETHKEIKEYLNSITCIIFVKCYKFDKYGRLLVDIYIDHETVNCKSISEILLSENLAYAYDGGTKKDEKEQITENII
jgi:endonuclease YncB( thermonuclease family)